MTDFVVIVVLALIIGSAIIYIRKAKKKGVNCIGCPNGGNCANQCTEGKGCGCRHDS